MSDTTPAPARTPATDVQAQLAAMQDQLDDLTAIVDAQQQTLEKLATAAGLTNSGTASSAARRR